MKPLLSTLLLALTLAPAAQPQQTGSPTDEILAPLLQSVDDWNRGDIAAFLECYESSPETTFVGDEVSRGTDALLARYRRNYPDQDHMGKTSFSELEARPLTETLAIVTGRYRLDRDAAFGGPAHGIFSLVLRKTDGRWRIIHDHTARLE